MQMISPDRREAQRWLAHWLGSGHELSSAVLNNFSLGQGSFYTVAGDHVDSKDPPGLSEGWVISARDANAWLARIFTTLSERGAQCVIVEDTLASPSDPGLQARTIPHAFVDDHVIAWCDLISSPIELPIAELMGVGGGYPTNAFVVTCPAQELGLDNDQQAPNSLTERIVKSLVAVILTAFDDESYLVWDLTDEADRLPSEKLPPDSPRESGQSALGHSGSPEPHYDYRRPGGFKARVYRGGRVELK